MQKWLSFEDCQAKAVVKDKRQVADFNIVKQVDEYRKREFECPLTNKTYTGEFPANVPGNIQCRLFFQALITTFKMFKAKEQAIAAGRSELTSEEKESFENRLNKGIAKGIKENPPPAPGKKGCPKKGRALSLFERLQKYKDALCLFARDFKVPFTSNEAERTFRCAKSKLKVAGEFRSENGAKDYLIIRSYTDTARKHGYSTYEAIVRP